MGRSTVACVSMALLCSLPGSSLGSSFVNWETAHVHPLELTPDGRRLLAVNTADHRLELFDVEGGTPVHLSSIPVGLAPVTARARSNTEVWVVNHVSDSVSIVDLTTLNVIATVTTDDEPADVVFAGNPERAFVSCSQVNKVQVFDPADLTAAPVEIAIDAEDPRAMAVSPDRATVYVAIFESGNRSTILGGGNPVPGIFPPNVVDDPLGPYGGVNPPPNDGATFAPPLNPANPAPPAVGLIVKKSSASQWLDDNGANWTDLVSGPSAALSGRPLGWDLVDHDVGAIDAATLGVSYLRGLMNLCMALAVNPATGQVSVVGTDATNEIRFEPNLNGRFLRVNVGLVEPNQPGAPSIVDLNPHLTYTGSTVPQAQRDLSIGDPRGIVWNAAGTHGYVAGMGSSNLVVIDAAGARAGLQPTVEVGEGPTGLALDESRERLYVLNKFEASVSVIDTISETELLRVPFHDPSPPAIKAGRRHLYGTHETSGLGHVACASCHPEARMDRLAWDLGNPAGTMEPFDQNCNFGSMVLGPGPCPDWHPMKGPMVTQTLQDIIGKEPHHWRGDRDGLEEFNQTFTNLQGDDQMLAPSEMQELEDLLATVFFPPNPHRNFFNGIPADMPLPGHYFTGLGGAAGQPLPNGNASFGREIFADHHLIPNSLASCTVCHTQPTGMGTNEDFSGGAGVPLPPGPNGELHHTVTFSATAETPGLSIKVPQLRNLHEKVGFEMTQTTSRAGFGFLHDGSIDSLARFMSEPFFDFGNGIDGPPELQLPAMVAFMLAFSGADLQQGIGIPVGQTGPLSQDTHAAVGRQLTFDGSNNDDPLALALLSDMVAVADATQDAFTPGPEANLVAKARASGLRRGYAYAGGNLFQADRSGETPTTDDLRTSAAPGFEVTFTVVPEGTQQRIGIDRDADGFFDRDELDACSDPGDPGSLPGGDAVPAVLRLGRSGTDTLLSWNEAGTTHEVVRGDLATLSSSGGDFATALDGCLADDVVETTALLPDAPGPESRFFLVRASDCGTYDSSGSAQVETRDAEVDASPLACSN